MRMGRYYLPNDALMQFFQSLKLCVEAIGPMPRRIRAGPQCGGASTHSSVLHIGVESSRLLLYLNTIQYPERIKTLEVIPIRISNIYMDLLAFRNSQLVNYI